MVHAEIEVPTPPMLQKAAICLVPLGRLLSRSLPNLRERKTISLVYPASIGRKEGKFTTPLAAN